MRKEKFSTSRRTKLHHRGDGHFQVKARVGDNAYILDLPGDYGVSATFNVADLSPFEFDDIDSRTSPFQQGGNDEDIDPPPKSQSTTPITTSPLVDPLNQMTDPMLWPPSFLTFKLIRSHIPRVLDVAKLLIYAV